MLVDDPSLKGNTTLIAENVHALDNPYENRIVYLLTTYGEYAPGLYVFQEGWRSIMYEAPLNNTQSNNQV